MAGAVRTEERDPRSDGDLRGENTVPPTPPLSLRFGKCSHVTGSPVSSASRSRGAGTPTRACARTHRHSVLTHRPAAVGESLSLRRPRHGADDNWVVYYCDERGWVHPRACWVWPTAMKMSLHQMRIRGLPSTFHLLLQLHVFPWKLNPHVPSWLLTSECCWADASSHPGFLPTEEPVAKIHMFFFLPLDLRITILNFN